MFNESFEDFQYNSCVSRGICSLSPRTSALQTVLVLYLRLFAKYAIEVPLDKISQEMKDFILNTVAITIYNPEFNESSFIYAVNKFKTELPKIMHLYSEVNTNDDMEAEKNKALELFSETEDIIQAIKFGERMFNRGQENIPTEIRDLYNIMLVVSKSLSINLLDLESFGKNHEKAFLTILNLLSRINLEEREVKVLRNEIESASKTDNELMRLIRDAQEERYGQQGVAEVSYSTVPGKAVLVVGSNIRELESVLEALKDENIDVYTHDDMMLAHTFPKFSEYKNLKGQFGQGVESCLLDFATFPGPIVLTKHSLHNIENLYRGRLFTTDYTSSPKGIIKIFDNDFSKIIETAQETKGFKRGKQCETIKIGYDYEESISEICQKLQHGHFNRVFIIGADSYSLERRVYFEKLIKLIPNDILVISFSYNLEKENLIHINTCFDNYSMIKFCEQLKKIELPMTVFIPKCDRSSVSQMVYLSGFKDCKIYVGKCTPIILNPSLMNTLQREFLISDITSAKKDLDDILKS